MTSTIRAVLLLLLALSLGCAGQGARAAGAPHLAMRLVADSDAPKPGSVVTLALDTRPAPGWHGYWRNPGDAGFPADFAWTLPAGARVGPVAWPVPTTLLIAGLMNYVYEAPYAPLVPLRVPEGLARGTSLPITLRTNYLVCTASLCVPEAQELRLTLTVGDGGPSAAAPSFARWRRRIPKPLGAPARFEARDGAVRIAIPFPAGATLDRAYFFPTIQGAIDYAAPQAVSREGDRLLIETRGKGGAAIDGVLRIGAGQGLAVHAAPGTVAGSAPGGVPFAMLVAFAGAVLGGLILNVMPCVFPILSLKALSLARSGADAAGARREALAYTAGVVLVCLALGGLILALRAGGTAVGWAFQLQDPRVVAVLLLLCVGIALNLSGAFELPTPRFAGRHGAGGAFATGALAAFVATPCTGPFMGAALGAALVLPWPAALAVFAGLGLGLALPFLLIGFVPALRRRLPRPGGWMVTLRRVLAVPMWLTALGLVWLLGRQIEAGWGVGLAVAALGAALLAWGGRRQGRGRRFGTVPLAALAVLAAGSVAASGLAARRTSAGAGDPAFSEARLASLRAARRPVFVYFTADWCLTCKVNEKAAIDTARTRDAFARKNVAVLMGDWTDGDPALGRFIEAHNRAGVPLYLYYAPGTASPRVLPQVLTPAMLEALAT